VENIFMFNGSPGHEIVLVYDGALKGSEWYEQDAILGKEANGEDIGQCGKTWMSSLRGNPSCIQQVWSNACLKAPCAIEGDHGMTD
jgi:hypothetical protein